MVNFLKPITKQCTKEILEQMENSFYKTEGKDGKKGIVFFSYIKYQKEKIPVLITNNDIINEDHDDIINVSINNNIKEIKLGDIEYRNKEYNIIIMEIEENKEDKIKFLEFDDVLYEKQSETYYNK